MVDKPTNSARGLVQWLEARFRSMLPRQARVTRSNGSNAWVRFVDESNQDPESAFPSLIASPPSGTMGWVQPLGGRKGLFLPWGIMLPITRSNGAWPATITINSAQTYEFNAPAIVEGLNPSRQYRVTVFGRIRASAGAAAQGAFGATVEHRDGSAFYLDVPLGIEIGSNRFYAAEYSSLLYPKSDGTFVARPAAKWTTGSFTVSPGYVTIIVQQEV